jgi:hypothetical protein
MEWIAIIFRAVLCSAVLGPSPATQPATEPTTQLGDSSPVIDAAPDAVRPILDAINRNHDNFLKNYRAVVLTMIPDSSMPMDALDVIWREGDRVREDHHLPGVELQDHPTPPLPKRLAPVALVAWAAQHEPIAKELVDSQREYLWFAGSAKAPRPRVQIALFHNFPHVVNDNSWPDAIQWPSRYYSAADFHLLDANAETPAGCIGLRIGSEDNYRADYFVDPSHDYVCIKQIEWNKRGAKWAKSRVFMLSGLRRIDGHIVAETERVRSYSYDNASSLASPGIVNEVTTIDLVPLTEAGYPPGIFDSASFTTGADTIDN